MRTACKIQNHLNKEYVGNQYYDKVFNIWKEINIKASEKSTINNNNLFNYISRNWSDPYLWPEEIKSEYTINQLNNLRLFNFNDFKDWVYNYFYNKYRFISSNLKDMEYYIFNMDESILYHNFTIEKYDLNKPYSQENCYIYTELSAKNQTIHRRNQYFYYLFEGLLNIIEDIAKELFFKDQYLYMQDNTIDYDIRSNSYNIITVSDDLQYINNKKKQKVEKYNKNILI